MTDVYASTPLSIIIVLSLIAKVLVARGNIVAVVVIFLVRYFWNLRPSSSESGRSCRPIA